MSTWTNAVITNQGTVLLAKLTQQNTLTITRASTGSGYVDPDDLQTQTNVTNPKQSLSFKTVTYPETGKCAIPMLLTNDSLSTGYTATQVGVFATDPDAGEILLFIAQATEGEGTVIPSATEMPGFSTEWTFYLQYGQADGVTVTVDPSAAITEGELQQAVAQINTQLGTKANQTDMTEVQSGLANKLDKSGGIMTGNIQMKTTNYTSTPVKVTDSGNTYGQLLEIGAGGDVIIGSGEAPTNLANAEGINGTSETVHVAADTTITLWVNCNAIANRKSIQINTSGQITVPTGPTANMHLATKQYVDGMQKKITSGTAAPSGGSSGDIYIQY